MKLYLYITNPAEYAAGSLPNFFADYEPNMVGGWHHIGEINVDLPPPSEFIENAEAQIDEAERKTREQFERKMAVIKDQRAKLLAIGHA